MARAPFSHQECDWLLSNVDFLPTLLDLIGAPVPASVQGRSFVGAFGRGEAGPPRDAIFGMFGGVTNESRCIRTDRYKLIRTFTPRRRHEVPIDITAVTQRVKCPVVELFDLERDPHEFTDVGADPAYAAVRADLSERLWAWLDEVEDPILRGPVPTPYYHEAIAEHNARVPPARDHVPAAGGARPRPAMGALRQHPGSA